MSASMDQQFIEFVVKSLVSRPDAVRVTRRIDEKGVLLELTVDPEDLGRVIGKHGATAQSLRTLLRALGMKNDARYNLKIVDNGEGGDVAADNGAARVALPVSDDAAASTTDADSDDDADDQLSPASERLQRTRDELKELDDLDV